MKTITLFQKWKVITLATPFNSEKYWPSYELKYADVEFNWEVSEKTWKKIPTDVIKKTFVSKKNLWPDFEKLSDDEICQELKGKSIYISTLLWD